MSFVAEVTGKIFAAVWVMALASPLAAGVVRAPGAGAGEGEQPALRVEPREDFPNSRQALFDIYERRILTGCRFQWLQAAADMDEATCRDFVRRQRPVCEQATRKTITSEWIERRDLFEDEFRQYLDCLIPPFTNGGEPSEGLSEELMAHRAWSGWTQSRS